MEIKEYRLPPAGEVVKPYLDDPHGFGAGFEDTIDIDSPTTIVWHMFRIVRRQVWKIVAFVVAVVAAALLYSAQLQPLYRSIAQLEVDPTPQNSGAGALSSGNNYYYYRDEEKFIETQLRLINSQEIAEAVVRDLGLTRSPLFGYDGGEAEVIPERLPGLSATMVSGTYLLNVAYVHTSPELCRDVANAVAKAYIEQGYTSRIQSAQDVNNLLNIQLEQLKADSETAQQDLLAYQLQHGIAGVEGGQDLTDQQLQQLQVELVQVESERIAAESALQSAQTGSVQDLVVLSEGGPITALLQKMSGLEEQMRDLSQTYGPNHPARKALQGRLDSMSADFGSARQSVIDSLAAKFRAASVREQTIRETYLAKKLETDRMAALAVEYGSLRRQAEAKTALYEDLLRTVSRVGMQSSLQSPSSLRVVSWAKLARAPFYPDIPQYLLWALLASTVIGVAVAVAGDYLDRTVRDTEQIEQWLRVPVLASLPRLSGAQRPQSFLLPAAGSSGGPLKRASHEAHALLEGFTMLRTSILLSSQAENIRAILIGSAVPAEGKSTVAAGLATAMAQQMTEGKRVLLIDGDLRRPTVHSTFSVGNQEGLSSLLEGRLEIDKAVQRAPGVEGLWLLTRGPAVNQPSELLATNMSRIVEGLRAKFEYIIVDSAPLLASADSMILATLVDGVILVARAGGTSREVVGAAFRQLKRVRSNVMGLILNQVKKADPDSYHYYYGYYQREDAADD